MSGTLAQTIMGEAGADPANQFAVASTIYNRMQAGTFPGGSDPGAIVNAPLQYTGFAATPNASADALANAITTGTLPWYGNTGNAVNFQSGQTAVNSGIVAGTNIGGNYFSDNLGAPTANFVAPQYTGYQVATGPADYSTGLPAGSSAYVNPNDPAGIFSQFGGSTNVNNQLTQAALDPSGNLIQVASSPAPAGSSSSSCNALSAIGGSIANTVSGLFGGTPAAQCSVGQAVTLGFSSMISGIEDWFTRGTLIVLGAILAVIGLIYTFRRDFKGLLPAAA